MARIIVCGTTIQRPLAGEMATVLVWLAAFKQIGHQPYLVERAAWPNSFYDPRQNRKVCDSSYGMATLDRALRRLGLENNWCFIDANGGYHGLSRPRMSGLFHTADLYLDLDWDEWMTEAAAEMTRAYMDGEPGWCQINIANAVKAQATLPAYDFYFTVGMNIGSEISSAPTGGKKWHTLFSPINLDLIAGPSPAASSAFTSVMNWRTNYTVEYEGVSFGQKDVEFPKFMRLPQLTSAPLEIAVSGNDVPVQELERCGWHLRCANEITTSLDSYLAYIGQSRGAFVVAKNVFVATRCGLFSDREGYYLAHGRPVVMQDTGFSEQLPCGEGLFAIRTVEEAAAAIDEVNRDYVRHSRAARDVAFEYLDGRIMARKLLGIVGIE
jgi:hypothetical protein